MGGGEEWEIRKEVGGGEEWEIRKEVGGGEEWEIRKATTPHHSDTGHTSIPLLCSFLLPPPLPSPALLSSPGPADPGVDKDGQALPFHPQKRVSSICEELGCLR